MTDYFFILKQFADAIHKGLFSFLSYSYALIVNFWAKYRDKIQSLSWSDDLEPVFQFSLMTIALLVIIIIVAYTINKHSSLKTVRASTKSQQKRLKKAKSCVSKVISRKVNFNHILSSMDGYTFELFVLEALRRVHKNIAYIDNIKLTNDGGIDGAFSLNGTWYIVQSKHYKGSVSTKDIELIGKKAEQFNESTHPYAKKMRKKHKFSNVKAMFATSGNITTPGMQAAKSLGVLIIRSDELVSSLRSRKEILH